MAEAIRKAVSTEQLQSLYRVHRSFCSFLKVFEETNGFNDLWHTVQNRFGPDEPGTIEASLLVEAEKLRAELMHTLLVESFYLHGLAIYEELKLLAKDFVPSLYQGKLSFAYRFLASHPETDEDRLKTPLDADLKAFLERLTDIYSRHGIW